jgi:glycerophosphoryl diester phosphodiesterase
MKNFIAIAFCLISLSALAQENLKKAHAHNDYEHAKPFFEAYKLGFGSIEADVYAMNGELLVSHNLADVKADRTLKSLYIDPIVAVLKAKKQGNFHQFLIDFKTNADSTLPLLIKFLTPHKELFIKSGLRIVISGNRPQIKDYINFPTWITFDGRSNETYPAGLKNYVVLESESVYKFGMWSGQSPMPLAMKEKLKVYVETVHGAGRKLRLWGTPNTLMAYQALWDLGVDYIGTDNLSELADFLKLAAK